MTSDSPLENIAYDSLLESLTDAGAVIALPELHGGICGALCAGGTAAAERWLDEALADPDVEATAELEVALRSLAVATWRALDDAELAFEPLLPDDDSDLDEQVRALASWCHGFLAALGLSAPDVGRGRRSAKVDESAPIAIEEILTDFAEIGRAGLTDEDAADRNQADFALAELKEYVRVSVQIVFDELAGRRAALARDVN